MVWSMALFGRSCFGLFQLVSAYSLSQNTIESAETSRLFHQPNQTTCLDPLQIREFMEIQSINYNGDTYHLISKNCNHFCEDICKRLTGNLIPKWVNRLARMGAVCNCILPEPLKINAARHDPGCQAEDSERKMLTGSFSCFSSISLCQRHFSTSLLSRRSPTEGTSWDTKQSNPTRLKKS